MLLFQNYKEFLKNIESINIINVNNNYTIVIIKEKE